jgi:hypothetical protein
VTLPFTANNGSCVAPCDFDNDGDMDLFVGSRSVPGAYGLSANQLLLENNGHGNFTDVTDERMKGLEKAGMVTDACWIDYDRDCFWAHLVRLKKACCRIPSQCDV